MGVDFKTMETNIVKANYWGVWEKGTREFFVLFVQLFKFDIITK